MKKTFSHYLVFILLLGFYILRLYNNSYCSNSLANQEKLRILVNFIAIGQSEERNNMLHENYLHLFGPDAEGSSHRVDCVIYAYASYNELPAWIHAMLSTSNRCKVKHLFGFSYDSILKFIDPDFILAADYDYLAFLLSDVAIYQPYSNFNLSELINKMIKYRLTVVTPSIIGSVIGELNPQQDNIPSSIGRLVDKVEVQALLMSSLAWACWYELVDLEYPSGWQDCLVNDYCFKSGRIPNGKMAVLDKMWVHHNPKNWPSTNNVPSGSHLRQQITSWKTQRNVSLIDITASTIGTLVE